MTAAARRAAPAAAPAERLTDWIDGRASDAGGPGVPVINPHDAVAIAEVAEADAAQVDRAVAAARAAFADGRWRGLPVRRRQDVLYRAAERLLGEAEALARWETRCSGLTYHLSTQRHVAMGADWLRYYAEALSTWGGAVHATEPGATALTVHEPRGVAALFAPWNVPLGIGLAKVGAALAVGCSIVLKPSEATPVATRRAVEILEEAGVPPGVVNLVNGRGAVTGAALAEHPGIDCVSFTGGDVAGRFVAEAAARRHVPAVLELGGKSAFVVFADADLDLALEGALQAVYANNGQACLAGARILLDRSIAADFAERFVARVRAIRIGDPFDPATELGPIASERHLQSILAIAARAAGDGATLLAGGDRVEALRPGAYLHPIVARADDHGHAVAQEEVFGPFATLVAFDGEEEAWRLANATRYGLAAYLWTRDHGRVLRGGAALRAGTVMVNAPFLRERNAPFGGLGASGTGSEGGAWSLRAFTQEKAIVDAHGWRPAHRWGAA